MVYPESVIALVFMRKLFTSNSQHQKKLSLASPLESFSMRHLDKNNGD